MGSVNGPNPWAPYQNYKDCSQGVCSIYCPQWCYIIFPPPPPSGLDDDSGPAFSPLIIAIIGILASAFLLVSYYTIITKYCRRRSADSSPGPEFQANRDEVNRDQWEQVAAAGLDDSLIKSITICRYKKGDGLVEGTECAVCLSEFVDDESLRLMPKCCHAFHPPCIDTWLKSHSSCPLCRANAVPFSPPHQAAERASSPASVTLSASALEMRRQSDLILVVDDRGRSRPEEVVVSVVAGDLPKDEIDARNAESTNSGIGMEEERARRFRRSSSFGNYSSQRNLLIADILRIEEDLEDLQGGNQTQNQNQTQNHQLQNGIGSSKGAITRSRGMGSMKRSVSTGRFMINSDERGKNSMNYN